MGGSSSSASFKLQISFCQSFYIYFLNPQKHSSAHQISPSRPPIKKKCDAKYARGRLFVFLQPSAALLPLSLHSCCLFTFSPPSAHHLVPLCARKKKGKKKKEKKKDRNKGSADPATVNPLDRCRLALNAAPVAEFPTRQRKRLHALRALLM